MNKKCKGYKTENKLCEELDKEINDLFLLMTTPEEICRAEIIAFQSDR